MKTITNFINERLHITTTSFYTCHPKTKYELKEIIIQRIKDEGQKCNLNDIDVSKIDNMVYLFSANPNYQSSNDIFKDFNGDISQWDVSNVKDMSFMFDGCTKFNCDISQWDVSNVKDMTCMFCGCENFNSDISRWDISNVKVMSHMFSECINFNQNLSGWDVSNVNDINWMFYNCKKFNCDISGWNVSNVKNMIGTFKDCSTKPKWYKGT